MPEEEKQDEDWETSVRVHRSTVMLIEQDKRKGESHEDVIVRWHRESKERK